MKGITLQLVLVFSMIGIICGASMQAQHPSFSVVDIGTLGGDESFGCGINNRGAVCGTSNTRTGDPHAFAWKAGRMTDLGALGGAKSWGYGLNNAGELVGTAGTADGTHHAFSYRNHKMRDIGAISGAWRSEADGVNGHGQVVSCAIERPGKRYAIVWERGTPRRLPDLGVENHRAWAWCINASGDIGGRSEKDTGETPAVLWQNGTPIELPTLGGKNGDAFGINDRGVIVGWADLPGGEAHACLWSGGKVRDLGSLDGRDGCAYAINNHGDVVGGSGPPGGRSTHAFLYTRGRLLDLTECIPAGSGWRLLIAAGINDRGEIVGSGMIGGHTHAFLLKPEKDSAAGEVL